MSRVLTIQRATVPPAARHGYVSALAARRAHYTGAQCRYWVFEETEQPGVFVEFIEANDAMTLGAAHVEAPPSGARADVHTYSEVEIP